MHQFHQIYTNFKATFLAFSKKTLYLSVQWQEQVKSSQLSTGMASVELNEAAYIFLTWGCYAAFEDIGTSS